MADEILVIDHCSTNGTPELAEEMGVKVIRRADAPINPIDFSDLWNFAIHHAKYDRVFVLAADECIHDEHIAKIGYLAENQPIVRFQIFTFFPDLDHYVDTWFPNFQNRIFPKECYYKDKVNETNKLYYRQQLLPHIPPEGEDYAQLFHYGWLHRCRADLQQKCQWSKLPTTEKFFKVLSFANFSETGLTHPKVLKRFPLRPPPFDSITMEDIKTGAGSLLSRFSRKKTRKG